MSDETEWIVQAGDGNKRTVESWSEAEAVKKDMEQFDMEATSIPPEPGETPEDAVQPIGDSVDLRSISSQQFPDPLTHLPA